MRLALVLALLLGLLLLGTLGLWCYLMLGQRQGSAWKAGGWRAHRQEVTHARA